MQRLDEIVAQLLAGARQRIVTEHECVASNDDAKRAGGVPGCTLPAGIPDSDGTPPYGRHIGPISKNRRRRRRKAG